MRTLTPQRRGEILEQRPANEPDGIRVLDEAGGRGYRTGNADANRARAAGAAIRARVSPHDRIHRRVVIVTRGRHADARDLAAAVECYAFDLRSTEIDADPQRHVDPLQPAGGFNRTSLGETITEWNTTPGLRDD